MAEMNGMTVSDAEDLTLWVLADSNDGKLIGIDSASGGYPWKPSHWQGVMLWPSKGEAEGYGGVPQHGEYKALKVQIIITDEEGA